MNPQKGQYVKCIFNDNSSLEGIVEFWSDQKSVLKSKDNKNILIIQRTLEDVKLVKIILGQSQIIQQPKSRVEQKFQQTLNNNPNPYDPIKNKKLAELKTQLIEQEKKIVAEKLIEHIPNGNQNLYNSQISILKQKKHG
jgi:hypothetical protein